MASDKITRWRRRKEARPGEVLAAALECFAERGFAATRLEDVAARAGVTKGTVYLYYSSKEELFKAVVRTALVPNLERIEQLTAAPGTAAELLDRLMQAWALVATTTRLGAIPKLIFAEAGNFPELAKFYLEEVVQRAFRIIAGILQRGVDSGEFRPINVQLTVNLVIAPLLFAMLWTHSLGQHADHPLDLNALRRAHLDLLLNGLKPSPPSPLPEYRERGESQPSDDRRDQ